MKEINKKYLIVAAVAFFLIIGASSFYVYDKFYAPLECGEKSYVKVDEVGREYCVFTDQITIQFKTGITYSEAVEIVKVIEGSSVDAYYRRRDQDIKREFYLAKIPAQTRQEQEAIANKLYKLNSNIKSITPVSHSFYEGPWPY